MSIWKFLHEVRVPYFAAMALPILLGNALAWHKQGSLDVGLFVMSLLAGIFLQAGTTMTNDFFDYQRTGKQDLLWALVPPEQVLQGALAFFVVGTMVGVYVALASGPLIWLLGIIGIASSYAYSVPPFRLSGSGLGELLAGLNLGLLTTLGGYYVQIRKIDGFVVWAALPVALLMSAVLSLNGFQPAKLAENRSFWSKLGEERAVFAYALPAMLAYALLIIGVALEWLPQVALLGLLGLPLAAISIVSTQMGHLSLAIVSAVGAHLSTTALLALAFVLHGFWL
ncbi:MAG: prenyltransferase [Ardenticatenaceae bacterium]